MRLLVFVRRGATHLEVELGLLAGSGVLVHDAALDILVNDRKRLGERRQRNRVIARLHRLQNLQQSARRKDGTKA